MKHFILVLTLLPFFTFCGENKGGSTNLQQQDTNSESMNNIEAAVNLADDEATTFFLLRHAEEIRTDPTNKNPILRPEGLDRARNLAKFFERTKIDTLYVTRYLPTRQTVTPITQQKMLKKTYFNPNRFDPVIFVEENLGKNIIVVGQRNEIPKIVNSIIGEERYKEMGLDDYSTIFKVTIKGDNKKAETLTIQ